LKGSIDTKHIRLDKNDVHRYAGQKNGDVSPILSEILEDVIQECCELSELRYVFRIFPAADSPIPLYGRQLSRLLEGSNRLAFFVLTAGHAVEQQVEKYFSEGSYARGMLLDAAATEMIEKAADVLEDTIKQAVGGLPLTTRFSPGYGEWDLSVQPSILKNLNSDEIGVSLNNSFFLIPRKTITAVMGIGGKCDIRLNGCDDCGMDCAYRKETST
jgi:hypothetical protein